ncbi:MAG: Ribonuclease HII [Chroococcopsis gigantea SAG 12.99]|jgi:ribonuclease HII|nr:ribonuclease HII [Chlorogloea purpurea SAG 13.99]MDV3002298.1 Ribonuclease HII [Chroococcopsis gigantea SAG 12.99]
MESQDFLDLSSRFLLPQEVETDCFVAGVDEVGRGCLFGPVVAAAVVFPLSVLPALVDLGVRDSKKLSPKRREALTLSIIELATSYSIGYAKAREIDRINILQASLWAMSRAVKKLKVPPDFCLVDGKWPIPDLAVPQNLLIKGDERSPVIGAASIVAKVWRDDLIRNWSPKYPGYDLAVNKGYGTRKHLEALKIHGATSQHRLSFRPCRMS